MADIIVTTTADSGAGSLRQAIADAAPGDTIGFDAVVFPENETTAILLASQLTIYKNIAIDADATARRVALDAQGAARCCYIGTGGKTTITGVVFRNANYSGNGGAVYVGTESPCIFVACDFTGNTGTSGGGISAKSGADISLANCIFSGNLATSNGGAVYVGAEAFATFARCTTSNNASGTNDKRRGIFAASTACITFESSKIDAVFMHETALAGFSYGITQIDELTAPNVSTIYINDGAAASVVRAADITGATIRSGGRGYLALKPGIDASGATLDNVVLCEYGAGVTAFKATAVDGYATFTITQTAAGISTLVEKQTSTGWDTVSTADPVAVDVGYTLFRVFDGAAFLYDSVSVAAPFWTVEAWADSSGGGGAETPSWLVDCWGVDPEIDHIER